MIRKKEIVPGEIIELVIEETCDLDDFLETIETHYHEGLKGVLWNASNAQVDHFTSSDMRRIAYAAKPRATHERTALFSPHDLQFGKLRMYEAYAELGNVAPQMMVFRDRDKAIEWLKE